MSTGLCVVIRLGLKDSPRVQKRECMNK